VSPFEDPAVLIRILFGFSVTAILVVVCRKLLNRLPTLIPQKVETPGRTLWTHSLGPRQNLHLVEVMGRVYLLGSSADRVEVIDRIEGSQVDEYLEKLDGESKSLNPTIPFVFQQIHTKINKNIQK